MNNLNEVNTASNDVTIETIRAVTDPAVKFFTQQTERPLAVIAQSKFQGIRHISRRNLRRLLLKKSYMNRYDDIHIMACEVSQSELNDCDIKFSIANAKKFATGISVSDGSVIGSLVSNVVIGDISQQGASIINIDIEQEILTDTINISVQYSDYPNGKYTDLEHHFIASAIYSLSDELTTDSEPFFVSSHLGDSMVGISSDMFEIADMSSLLEHQDDLFNGEVKGTVFYTQLKNPKPELVS